jgi:SAM-dependent methyltransferase
MAMHATELLSVDQALKALPGDAAHASSLFARLRRIAPLEPGADVADIGAAQGLFLIACARLGYRAVGVEPFREAREAALAVAERLDARITLVDGTAEEVLLPAESFDVVHAKSVIEHVADANAAFREAFRLLRPGGVFWFWTASSLCPQQAEIRGFPAFGWYPDPLKQRIMHWAARNRPELVGHTQTPAIHWFTPRKARRMLLEAGFSRVYDRWQLRLPEDESGLRRTAVTLLHSNSLLKLLADMLVPGCAYAAIK